MSITERAFPTHPHPRTLLTWTSSPASLASRSLSARKRDTSCGATKSVSVAQKKQDSSVWKSFRLDCLKKEYVQRI